MIWPWSKPETRSYTEDRIAVAVAQADGRTASSAVATIEACAGLWSRGFAAGESDALTAPQLAMIGRQLLMAGNSVWLVDDGRVTLPAHTWDIRGGSDPALWRYRLDIAGPSPENSWRVPIPVQTQEPPYGTSAVLTTTCATTEALV